MLCVKIDLKKKKEKEGKFMWTPRCFNQKSEKQNPRILGPSCGVNKKLGYFLQ